MTQPSSTIQNTKSAGEAPQTPCVPTSLDPSEKTLAYARFIERIAFSAEKNFEAACLLKQQGMTMRRLYLGVQDSAFDNRTRLMQEELQRARKQAEAARRLRHKYTKFAS